MIRWLLLLLVACGPGLRRDDPRILGKDALTGANAERFESMMGDEIVNGGLLFDDDTCAKEFGVAGSIKGDRRAGFAKCLEKLGLRQSLRESALGDVVIMEYAPGIEVEVRVVHSNDGLRLRWIGYASRSIGDLDVPTITKAALERLRLAGDPHGPLDPVVAGQLELDQSRKGKVAFTWIKICLDANGTIAKAEPYEVTSAKAATAFADAAAKWKFRPFVTRGQAMPVCSLARMAYPPAQAPLVEELPMPPAPSRSKKRPIVLADGAKLLEGRRIAGEKMIVPDDETKTVIQQSNLVKLVGSFRICVDETGRAETVVPMKSTGFAEYDARIIAGMRQWAYTPFEVNGEPIPVCTSVTFIYSQR